MYHLGIMLASEHFQRKMTEIAGDLEGVIYLLMMSWPLDVDGIRGDSDRIISCWQYMKVIFKANGQKIYSTEALNLLQ